MNNKKSFFDLICNIALPVLILNKGEGLFAPIFPEKAQIASLLTALSLPLIYGLAELIKSKKINFIALMGFLGVGLTGGLALWEMEGVYFAVKEALIPLLLACAVFASSFFKKPLVRLLLFKSSLFEMDQIMSCLKAKNKGAAFEKLMLWATRALGWSFVLSAVLNFIIALYVFKDIDPSLEESVRRQILNRQLADMTWMGYVFIALPLSLITGFVMWRVVSQLKALTGLKTEDLLKKLK